MAKIEAGEEKEVFERLRETAGLIKASLTYGIYDVCLEVEFATMEELDDFVFNKVRKISGIKETVTLVTSLTVIPQISR